MSQTIPNPRRWAALALLCAAQFIVILDTSIVGVALPAVQADLGFSDAGLSWIFNAYVIAFGGLLLMGGKVGDVLGPRRVFAAGFAVLTAASLVAGLASSTSVLLIARALQGVGAALIAPAALTILMLLFSQNPKELGRAFGFWGAAAAAGGTAGVFLGGVVTEWLDWPWTFFINVPFGIAVLLLTGVLLPAVQAARGRIGLLDGTLVTAAIGIAVFAVVTAEAGDLLQLTTLLLIAAAAGLMAAFLVLQSRRAAPLLPLRLFRAPGLSSGNLIMALLGAAWIPLWFFLNLYLQEVLGLGALESGLALVPMTLLIMILMVWAAGPVIGRFGRKAPMVLGLLLLASSLFLLARLGGEPASYWIDVLPATLIAAVGMSLVYIPTTITAMSGARAEDAGLASGLVNTTYQTGSALGLAVVVAVAAGGAGGGDAYGPAFLSGAAIALIAALAAATLLPGRTRARTIAAE
ncbi:MAG: MFS transporter [Bauldia sp.]|nr:MFS transporter [Bauldia sp.]